jgi:hypothetical protein
MQAGDVGWQCGRAGPPQFQVAQNFLHDLRRTDEGDDVDGFLADGGAGNLGTKANDGSILVECFFISREFFCKGGR